MCKVFVCAVERCRNPVGEIPTRRLVAAAGNNQSDGGGNDAVEASGGKVVYYGRSVSRQAATRVNAEQAPKLRSQVPTRHKNGEGRCRRIRRAPALQERPPGCGGPAGVLAVACRPGFLLQHGKPLPAAGNGRQLGTRESQTRLRGVAERRVVPRKPGNSGGGKGPQLKGNAGSSAGPGD